MKRKLSLFIIFLLVLTLCGCSQTKEDTNTIATKYYTITLPQEWDNKCICKVTSLDSGTYLLDLYEKTAFEEMGAGKICSVMLFPTGDKTYRDFPDYQLLAVLDTPEGSYAVIALFPTDVQFNKDTAEKYSAMYMEVMDVLYSIQPTDGVEMAMP